MPSVVNRWTDKVHIRTDDEQNSGGGGTNGSASTRRGNAGSVQRGGQDAALLQCRAVARAAEVLEAPPTMTAMAWRYYETTMSPIGLATAIRSASAQNRQTCRSTCCRVTFWASLRSATVPCAEGHGYTRQLGQTASA